MRTAIILAITVATPWLLPSWVSAAECPPPGDLLAEQLPSAETVWDWNQHMAALGPRHTGSPAHKAFLDFLEANLQADGIPVERVGQTFERWDADQWSLLLEEDGREKEIPVAAYYPYSGSTPPDGVSGELVDVGLGLEADFRTCDCEGKIALVDVPILPLPVGTFYPLLWYLHDPAFTTTPVDDYKRAWTTILHVPDLTPAREAGAKGVVLSLDASAENAAGQYTPFGRPLQGIPGLYVDRETGEMLRNRVGSGRTPLTLTLETTTETTESDHLIATVPGKTSEEVILVNTHSDGPNAIEENGTLGMLAMAKYFASLPSECRERTLVFLFATGHFADGVESTDHFVETRPETIEKTVAGVTIEHLGAEEWLDDEEGFHGTGHFEFAGTFVSQNPVPVVETIDAIVAEDIRRASVLRPIGTVFFGEGAALHNAGIPTVAYITGPNYLLSWAEGGHIDKINPLRMHDEIRAFTRVVSRLDSLPAEALGAGDTLVLGEP